jgi:2-keto-4-pentenoate hydratase/2-oxohepta-3-ene-1,7-dioic acid hydratase in catechol pathway
LKIATFKIGTERKVGVIDEGAATIAPFDMSAEQAQQGIQHLLELQVAGTALPATGAPLSLEEVCLEAPLPRPRRNIFCVGKNYHDHAHEFSNSGFDSSAAQGAVPEHPIVFSKVPESVIGTGAFIEYDPGVSSAIDYEVELAVIIGKPGRGISRENALDHVWGYTIVNDVTARDLQGRYSQWLVGKSQDTFCPMGPVAVSRDDIKLDNTAVRTWINDELRQDSNTGLLIFDVPTIIATISAGVTLLAGDVIATGTPAGVGIGFKPPKYMTDGDVVRCEIEGIGQLQNTVKQRRS